jgi:MFS family permease
LQGISVAKSKNGVKVFNTTVLVGALGYFVDIYDLVLFSIVRIDSLKALGVGQEALMSKGVTLLNTQMTGMLLGGIIWGMLGDKRGRVSVLYGSILMYSLANIANAFVGSFEMYALLRLIAGIGLAGELGAAVTLVSENMPISHRGYGVAVVAAIGILGAIVASFVAESFSWQSAYLVGGFMGLVLLAFRIKMQDSALFKRATSDASIRRGNFLMFFTNRTRFFRYMSCIFIGAPNWFIIGILAAFAPEITASRGALEPVVVAKAIAWLYLGLSLGDLASGFLSQAIKSRKKVVALFLSGCAPIIALYLALHGLHATTYYALFFVLGLGNGYWAVFVTTAAEQFGTNLRATAATTVPNFVRAMVIPLTLGVQALKADLGLIGAVALIGTLCLAVAGIALYYLDETYHKDLNFLES